MKKYAIIAVGLVAGVLIGANAPDMRLASGKLLVGNASGIAAPVTISGDITVSNSGVAAMAANAIVAADITDGEVGAAEIATGAVGTDEIAANVIVSADIDKQVIQVSNTQLTNAQVLALRATPITLVASPAAGFAVQVYRVCLVMSAAAGAYTESSDDLAIEYAGGTDLVMVDMTDGFDDAAVTVRCYTPVPEASTTVLSAAGTACSTTCGGLSCIAGVDSDGNANGTTFVDCSSASADSCLCRGYATPTAAVAVQAINTGNGEWGGGNAANTLSIRVIYSIIPTTAFSTGG